ncbi:MAG: hypothetical protein CRN43_13785 [Candidatus Nephrothrix sp. EaCA]|nr:MAG: hypothetical protein CRN43_13785 [Candidatus Nephrothrix sp. EaCA]
MLDQKINEQLGLLQNELRRLKTATDYIDGAKENSVSIIAELEKVQQNYAVYTDKIFNLYKQYVADLKQNTEIQINDGVLKFETTGNKIDAANKEKLVETKRLLEQYKKIVEATDSLVKTLESVDFPARLSSVDTNIKAVNSALNEAKQSIEKKAADNQNLIIQRLELQDKKAIDNQNLITQRLELQDKKAIDNQNLIIQRLELQDKKAIDNQNLITQRLNFQDKEAIDNQNLIIQRLELQDKEIKLLKTILFVVCGLIAAGTMLIFFKP